jgi:NADPH-dependent 2,4-dienoyl-CoA reductase/sulfur reductase-like enzyme
VAPIEGTDLADVFTMHYMHSAAQLRAFLTPPDEADESAFETDYVDVDVTEYPDRELPETAAIVGGGYVGVEMAEAFRSRGLETHLYQRSARPVPPFGDAVGQRVGEALEEADAECHFRTAVNSLEGDGYAERVETGDGSQAVDLVLMGIGIRLNTQLVEDTGIEFGDSGAIRIDEYGRTTVENVYAAGDCAEKTHTVTGDPAWVPLGLTANRAGRAIGQTIAGDPEPVGEIAGTAVLKAFELEC